MNLPYMPVRNTIPVEESKKVLVYIPTCVRGSPIGNGKKPNEKNI